MMEPELEPLKRQAEAEGKVCVVGALIKDGQGRVFVQKRAPHRRLFPNCWDIVGGHVEAGETFSQALAGEIWEETGWQLSRLGPLLSTLEWEANRIERREFNFLVEIKGDLERPALEETKVSEYCWLGSEALELLKENRHMDDLTIFFLVQQALSNAPET